MGYLGEVSEPRFEAVQIDNGYDGRYVGTSR